MQWRCVAKPVMVLAPQALVPHQAISAEEAKRQMTVAFKELMEMGHASPRAPTATRTSPAPSP